MRKSRYRVAQMKRYNSRGVVDREWYQVQKRVRFLGIPLWWVPESEILDNFKRARAIRELKEGGQPIDTTRTEAYYYGEDTE